VLLVVLEIALVVGFGIFATRGLLDFDPNLRINGHEFEWNTSALDYVAHVWHSEGYIPRWNPYINRGMPTVDQGFTMLFHPLTGGLALLAEPASQTMKVSATLVFIYAGLGGLAFGYVMRWGLPARLLLAGLLITQSAPHALIGQGYFQLGLQILHFIWLPVGIVGLARGQHPRRWTVLLAVAFALIFLAGNIFYILPAALVCLLFGLPFMVGQDESGRWRVNRGFIARAARAALLAAGLMAVTAVSIVLHFGYVGGHNEYFPTQPEYAITRVAEQFFTPEELVGGFGGDNRYLYSVPWWLVAFLFVVLPPIPGLLQRAEDPRASGRVWIAAIIGLVVFFTWGVSINPVINWAWNTFAPLREWRFFERLLPIAAFFLILLVSLRADGLWQALRHSARAPARAAGQRPRAAVFVRRGLAGAFAAVLFAGAVAAPVFVRETRIGLGQLQVFNEAIVQCVTELRARRPNAYIAIDRLFYDTIFALQRQRVRLAYIGADYDQTGGPPTLYEGDLTNLPPPYVMVPFPEYEQGWRDAGYGPVAGIRRASPNGDPCFWYGPEAVPYAFAVSVADLEQGGSPDEVTADAVRQTLISENPELILVAAENPFSEPAAVVVQTIAYPGWAAYIDGQPARLESVGFLLGVVMPADSSGVIAFVYTPDTFIIGGAITVLTVIFTIGYLLRLDERAGRWRAARRRPA
jgi:hypothetical protein